MILRNPKFGNTFKVDTGVTIHELMDSDVQVFLPSDHPALDGFTVAFEAMSDEMKDTFVDFVDESAGELITLTDHEGTIWEGMIMDAEIVITEGKGCKWETSFKFEGTRNQ